MLNKSARPAVIAAAAKGNRTLRTVLEDMYERLDEVEAKAAPPPAAKKSPTRRSRKKEP